MRHPLQVFPIIRSIAKLHSAIHEISISELPSQREKLHTEILSVSYLNDDEKRKILSLLESLPDSDRVCHGDFNPDNILFSNGKPTVIDWASATKGNPLADVARTILMIKLGAPPEATPSSVRTMLALARKLISLDRMYLKNYVGDDLDAITEVSKWMIVTAAARLSEGIEKERNSLLKLIKQGIEGNGYV